MSDSDRQARILHRLQSRTLGMTSRELARSLRMRPADVTRELLKLQQTGQVTVSVNRWKAANARGDLAGNVRTAPPPGPPVMPPTEPANQPTSLPADTGPAEPKRFTSRLDRRHSRWATFRRLCDYYVSVHQHRWIPEVDVRPDLG